MPYSPFKEKSTLHRERPWVFVYGALLAGTAGYVNAVLLGIYHVPVSHMSGAVARLAIDLSTCNRQDLEGAMAIFFAFLCGAILSGLVIGGTKVQPGRRYGVAMMFEGALLALATFLLVTGRSGGIATAAMACGLQNAMASSYCGLILRTTHVTGIVTDIGVMLGHWLRYRRTEFWKLVLLLSILCGFFGGGLLGAACHARVGAIALLLVAAGCTLAGAFYYAWRRRHLNELPLERWGYFPPQEADSLK
ncbi:membrane protein [Desulfuromonas versatilis]|uniref:Membrane protein n=1 Tax=Desulfuromonas versatilis TaxID=2802975 RepID=A0ABM9SDI5_9BACT|nr:YoaK family protein [Desulfuromonas versatilis]BCR03683.1 membrane protein [Desulfuromonas versatilis]